MAVGKCVMGMNPLADSCYRDSFDFTGVKFAYKIVVYGTHSVLFPRLEATGVVLSYHMEVAGMMRILPVLVIADIVLFAQGTLTFVGFMELFLLLFILFILGCVYSSKSRGEVKKGEELNHHFAVSPQPGYPAKQTVTRPGGVPQEKEEAPPKEYVYDEFPLKENENPLLKMEEPSQKPKASSQPSKNPLPLRKNSPYEELTPQQRQTLAEMRRQDTLKRQHDSRMTAALAAAGLGAGAALLFHNHQGSRAEASATGGTQNTSVSYDGSLHEDDPDFTGTDDSSYSSEDYGGYDSEDSYGDGDPDSYNDDDGYDDDGYDDDSYEDYDSDGYDEDSDSYDDYDDYDSYGGDDSYGDDSF